MNGPRTDDEPTRRPAPPSARVQWVRRHAGRISLTAAAVMGFSAWGVHLGNCGTYSRLAYRWLGPDPTPSTGSAPPYLRWDVAGMLACGFAFVTAGVVLLGHGVSWWWRRGGKT